MSLFPTRHGEVWLVVDVQNAVMAECDHAAATIATIADLVGRARLAGTPVVWVRHEDAALKPGTQEWQIVPQLIPEPGEQVVDKRWGDAFTETTLEDVLGEADADHLWLVGAQSDFCVRSTLFGALHRGYDVTLVEDAHTTALAEFEGQRFCAAQLVALVNRLAWTTRIPGVASRLARAYDVEFAAARPDDEDLLEQVEADEQAEEDADDVELGLADEAPEA